MNEQKLHFLTTSQAASFFNVSPNTIRSWDTKGFIKTIRLNGKPQGQRRYDVTSFDGTIKSQFIEQSSSSIVDSKKGILYCRVSSKHQESDLQRQINKLQQLYPTYEVIKDIGSGINFKRPGFLKLFERAISKDFSELVVAHRDRLSRFGFDFIQWLFNQYGIKVLVHDSENFKTPEQELAEDLLSIVHVFSCRQNGRRKYKIINNPQKEELKEDID